MTITESKKTGQTSAGRRLHAAEKRVAHRLTKLATMQVREENLFVNHVMRGISKFNAALTRWRELTPAQIASMWSVELKAAIVALESYLESLGDFSDNVAAIIEEELTDITITEAIKSPIFKVDKRAINTQVGKKWTKDGLHYTDRIETLVKGAGPKFDAIFKKGFADGLGYREMLRQAKKEIAADAWKLERIIRTEGQRIQNDIAINTYRRNQQYISGIEYTSALDVRTCMVCGSYDRANYYFDGAEKGLPDVNDAPYIPAHPCCRCFYSPISRFWEGLIGPQWERQRASSYGYVTGDYETFLRRVAIEEPAWLEKHLGKFYQEWLQGRSIHTLRFSPKQTISDLLGKKAVKVARGAVKKATPAIAAKKETPLTQQEKRYQELSKKYSPEYARAISDIEYGPKTQLKKTVQSYIKAKGMEAGSFVKSLTSQQARDIIEAMERIPAKFLRFVNTRFSVARPKHKLASGSFSPVERILKIGLRNEIKIRPEYVATKATPHEFGHGIHSFVDMHGTPKEKKLLAEFMGNFFDRHPGEWNYHSDRKNVVFPSDYARTNAKETFAEYFGHFYHSDASRDLMLQRCGNKAFRDFVDLVEELEKRP